jgi:hypothetical protein
MPPVLSKLKAKLLNSHTREVVHNGLCFMDYETKDGVLWGATIKRRDCFHKKYFIEVYVCCKLSPSK